MDNLYKFIEAIDYRITGGAPYQWKCYGATARFLDCWVPNVASVNAIFDSVDQTLYEVRATFENGDHKGYVWYNPAFKAAFLAEAKNRAVVDEGDYASTDCLDDVLAKAKAMLAGEDFDRRVVMTIDMEDDLFVLLARQAHEKDVTFNKHMEDILEKAVAEALADKPTDPPVSKSCWLGD